LAPAPIRKMRCADFVAEVGNYQREGPTRTS
jgi:hypothetical protein